MFNTKKDYSEFIRKHIDANIKYIRVSHPIDSQKTIRLKQLGNQWVEEKIELDKLSRIKKILGFKVG